ncbi:MAG: hypothetical protein M3Q63_00830 [bacterium]|nr:hypothetical protein [bacterium]
MALVEFESDQKEEFHIRSPKISLFGDPETPTMIKLLLKSKLVKTERQAFYVLISFIIVTVIIIASIIGPRLYQGGNNVLIDANGNETSVEDYLKSLKSTPHEEAF